MSKVTIEMVKDLRSKTGSGIMDCHTALSKCAGDLEAAEKLIAEERKTLQIEARPCGAGVIHSYIHMGGHIGVLVEVACGTDFAAKTDEFKTFVHDLAMHIAAMKPSWISPEDAPWNTPGDEEIDSSRYLILQPFIKDGGLTIGDLLTELSDRIGEPCVIKRFIRWDVGDEITPEEAQPLDKPKGLMIVGAVMILLAMAATFFLMLCA